METHDTPRDAATGGSGGAPERLGAGCLPSRARQRRAAFVVSRLDARSAEQYRDLTLPRYRPLLAKIADDPSVVAVGAARFGRSVGLALAELSSDGAAGRVLSLFVRPGYLGIGMGTALFAALEELLAERGCRHLRMNYPADGRATAVMEAVFRKAGWQPPSPHFVPHPTVDRSAREVAKRLYPAGRSP